jgi:hypothetical protein
MAGRSTALALPPDFLSMSGTGRLNAILNLPDPDRFIARLRGDEFVYLINGIGLEDAGGLVRYATTEQKRLLVDMDAWDGPQFVPERFDRIIDVFKEHGLDFTLASLREIDPGVLILSLIKRAKFHTVEEAEDMEFADGTWFMTPDNTFMVECQSEDDVVPTRSEIDLLYAIGVDYAVWVIHATRWETVASVEEHSFESRRGRLADTGFPEEDDVFAIYEPFDFQGLKERVTSGAAGTVTAGVTPGEPLALAVSGTPQSLFFWRVLSAPGAEKLNSAWILSQILNLVNRVMGAEVRDLSDVDAWGAVTGHAVTMASLGLEALSDGDVEVGLSVLGKAVPLELYRAGIEYSRPVSIIARQIVADVGGMANIALFGDPAAADIDAAAAFPVKCPPSISGSGGAHVDFADCGQVALAVAMMKKFRAVVQFAKGVLGFDPTRRAGFESIDAPRFASVVATAWARQILDGSLSMTPLGPADLARLRTLAFDGTVLKASVRIQPRPDEDEYSAAVREFLNESLGHVESALGHIDASSGIDPELVGDCLLVVRG